MIQPKDITLAIILMAMITFAVRYVFFTTTFEIRLPNWVKTLLTFTAPCILTAMFVPIMFQDLLGSSGHESSVGMVSTTLIETLQNLASSSYFWASVFAIVCSMLVRNTLLVILMSMAVFFALKFWLFL